MARVRLLHHRMVLASLRLEELEQGSLRVRGERLEADVRLEERFQEALEEDANAEFEEVVGDVEGAEDGLHYVRQTLRVDQCQIACTRM